MVSLSNAIWSLRRRPVYIAVVVASLVVGLAFNGAMFLIVDRLVLNPLPFQAGRELVLVGEDPLRGWGLSYADAREVRRSTAFRAFALAAPLDTEYVRPNGTPVAAVTRVVSGSYFSVLGAHAIAGRLLRDDDAGSHRAVISQRFWRAHLAASQAVLGTAIRLNDTLFTIVGVAAADAVDPSPRGLREVDIWMPIDPEAAAREGRGDYRYTGLARLRSMAAFNEARADVARTVALLAARYPVNHRFYRSTVEPVLHLDAVIGAAGRSLVPWLFAASLLVLLVAVLNVASLGVTDVIARRNEFCVRKLVGATDVALFYQLLCEALIVTALSAALAYCGVRGLANTVAGALRFHAPGIAIGDLSPRVVWYAIAVTTCCALLMSTLQSVAVAGLSERGGASGSSVEQPTLRTHARIVAELSGAVALSICALVAISNASHGGAQFAGFEPAGLYAIHLPHTIRDPHAAVMAALRATDVANRIPGVTMAALTEDLPLRGEHLSGIRVLRRDVATDVVANTAVSSSYFSALGLRLEFGRAFTVDDRDGSRPVAIVSELLAQRYFGTRNAVGRRIALERAVGSPTFPERTIVGVVSNARESAVSPIRIYVPIAQLADPHFMLIRAPTMSGALASSVASAIADAFGRASPGMISLGDLAKDDGRQRMQAASLLVSLAVAGIALASLGIVGAALRASKAVAVDVGIRQVLGATPYMIIGGCLRQAVSEVIVALGLGAVVAGVFIAAYLRTTSTMVEVSPTHLVTAAILFVTLHAALSVAPLMRSIYSSPAQLLRNAE